MKVIQLIIIVMLALPVLSIAQTSGVIYYTSTSKMTRELPPNMPEEIRKMIPKEIKINKELYFNSTASMFKNGEQEMPEDGEFEGGDRARRIRMRMMGGGRADEQTYTDIASKASVKTRDIMGKTFLIEDDPTEYKWKMTGEKKQILDYLAMEATTDINDSTSVSVWFTPQIPVSVGPGDLAGLPGAILEATFDDKAQRTIIVTNIELKELEEDEIEKPKKGKKVTQEEFNTIRKEKMEEMRGQRGRRGGFRVRRSG